MSSKVIQQKAASPFCLVTFRAGKSIRPPRALDRHIRPRRAQCTLQCASICSPQMYTFQRGDVDPPSNTWFREPRESPPQTASRFWRFLRSSPVCRTCRQTRRHTDHATYDIWPHRSTDQHTTQPDPPRTARPTG